MRRQRRDPRIFCFLFLRDLCVRGDGEISNGEVSIGCFCVSFL